MRERKRERKLKKENKFIKLTINESSFPDKFENFIFLLFRIVSQFYVSASMFKDDVSVWFIDS